jgi:hypothetical protein
MRSGRHHPSPRLELGPLSWLPALLPIVACAVVGCDNQLPNDPAQDAGPPTALGSGSRIRQIMNPALKTYPASGASVSISGATFLLVDTYDETHDGKSKGTVYLEDVPTPQQDAAAPVPLPYSATSLYSPTYLPANLEPAPGDILSLVGTFTINTSIGSAVFSSGEALVQIDKPVVQPSFEYQVPAPLVIQASDLAVGNYAKGLQWESMLVTIENVTFPDNLATSSGRETIHITSDTSQDAPTLSNELFDVGTWNSANGSPLAQGKSLKSLTGIVTWFFNFHIAPRSEADIVVQ